MNILTVNNLVKDYNSTQVITHVLKGINLEIGENEFVLITGTSGSGKTTLLNCISGLESITSGEVLFNGMDFNKISAKEMAEVRSHKIGFVFQAYNLLPNLTIYENIAIAAIIANKNSSKNLAKEQKEKILNLLEKFNLLEFKNYFPNQVSGGMQQRCAIVRSLINDPDVIFADEPTGNLDSKSSQEVMENFKLLHESFNKTIVMVTHSLDHLKYATRHIQLIDGMIISDEVIAK